MLDVCYNVERSFGVCGIDSNEFGTHSTKVRKPEVAASIAWDRTATSILAPDTEPF